MVRLAKPRPGLRVLDLGVGTGLLAERFAAAKCRVTGVDFSGRMLQKARERLPEAELVKVDVLGPWPPELGRRFERIVSCYVLHEFPLGDKVRLLSALLQRHLSCTGRIVVGDISFPDAAERDLAHRTWGEPGPEPDPEWKASRWDEGEHYWVADEAVGRLAGAGLGADYVQVSSCGGVYVMEPREPARLSAPTGST